MTHSLQYKLPVLVPRTGSTAAVLHNYTTFTRRLRCYLIKWLEWKPSRPSRLWELDWLSHLKEVCNSNQGWYLISYAVRSNVAQTSCLRSYLCIRLISGSFLHLHNTAFQSTKERVASFDLVLDTDRWLKGGCWQKEMERTLFFLSVCWCVMCISLSWT